MFVCVCVCRGRGAGVDPQDGSGIWMKRGEWWGNWGVLNVDGLGEAGEDDHLHPLHRVQPEQMVPPWWRWSGGGGRRRAG